VATGKGLKTKAFGLSESCSADRLL